MHTFDQNDMHGCISPTTISSKLGHWTSFGQDFQTSIKEEE